MEYSKGMIRAMTMTLRAYDRLIANPGKERGKWEDYGTSDGCRLCKVGADQICAGCILHKMNARHDGCVGQSMCDLDEALMFGRDELIAEMAKIRRDEIIKHLDKLGYKYGEVPIWEA